MTQQLTVNELSNDNCILIKHMKNKFKHLPVNEMRHRMIVLCGNTVKMTQSKDSAHVQYHSTYMPYKHTRNSRRNYL